MGREHTPLVIVDADFAAAARADATVEEDIRRKWRLRDVDRTLIVDNLPVAGAPAPRHRARWLLAPVLVIVVVVVVVAIARREPAAPSEPAPDEVAAVAPAPKPSAAERAYRRGVQLFARGDTASARTSLRAALAAEPTHAASWRVLGLVHERRGERADARTAFERYLALAPGAEDAAVIRGRMERL